MDKFINKVIQGDCLEVMKHIPDKSIDLILTDPPYGIKADKGIGGFGTSKTDKHYKGGWDNNRPSKEYFDEIIRISKQAIIFGGNFFADLLPQGNHWIFWDKKGDIKFQNPYSDGELIWTNVKLNTVKKIVFKQQGFIKDTKDERYHPTQKPSELIQQLIEKYSKDGDIILDPFAGSGTTGVACKNLGRNYILMEKEPEYIDIINKRLLTKENK